MTSPFEIPLHSSIEELRVLQELGHGTFIIEAPTAHPLFETYIVQATPDLGIVWIKGLTAQIENDSFGTTTCNMVDRIAAQLTDKYGRPEKVDFLREGSVWNEPQDWMSALTSRERVYYCLWERKRLSQMPDDLETIFVGATPQDSHAAAVALEYASPKQKLLEAEQERRMADLL